MSKPRQIVSINLEPLRELGLTISHTTDCFKITFPNETKILPKPDNEKLTKATKSSKAVNLNIGHKKPYEDIKQIIEDEKIEYLYHDIGVLRRSIQKCFHTDQKFKDLCQDLQINYYSLAGEGINKACDLAQELATKGKIQYFVDVLKERYPDLMTPFDKFITPYYNKYCVVSTYYDKKIVK